jgi:hypothetical protein
VGPAESDTFKDSPRHASILLAAEGDRLKALNVQLQPGRLPGLDVEAAVAQLQGLAPASVSRGEEDGSYVNIGFEAADVLALWSAVRERLLAEASLAQCVIVCCEGQRGWDDYRLLHHYDPSQPTDEAS